MYYSGIEPCDVLNGEGFRTVIWVSGCSIGCYGCFNPDTHNPNYGKEYTQETQKYLLDCLTKDYIDGITITGGNPLESYNLDAVLGLVNKIRLLLPKKTIWLYTGYDYQKVMRQLPNLATKENNDMYKRQQIIKQCDVLVDGRYIDSQRDVSLRWRGSSNQNVVDVQQSLQQNKIVLYCD